MQKAAKRILQLDMLIQCIFWIVFSFFYASDQGLDTLQHQIIMAMMLANGVVFAILAVLIAKERLIVNVAAFLFIFVNTILTLTDQMGLFDYLILILNIVALICASLLAVVAKKTHSAQT